MTTFTETDWIGRTAERRLVVSADLLDRFVELSGDTSPIHVSDASARSRGFERRIVHGMLLGALVSEVIGTELPGAAGVLQEMKLSFRKPCYVDDEISIRLRVTDFVESVQTLRLSVTIAKNGGTLVATGYVQSGVRADSSA